MKTYYIYKVIREDKIVIMLKNITMKQNIIHFLQTTQKNTSKKYKNPNGVLIPALKYTLILYFKTSERAGFVSYSLAFNGPTRQGSTP